ncbi:hypothetical protein AAHC03_022749 [Spirometra sp. Aus1]
MRFVDLSLILLLLLSRSFCLEKTVWARVKSATKTSLSFEWSEPPSEGPQHVLLKATTVTGTGTSVESRTSAKFRYGFLQNLEPYTYYSTSVTYVYEDSSRNLSIDTGHVQTRPAGIVRGRPTVPSLEVTNITSTCIYFKWSDQHSEAGYLQHYILQGIAANSNQTVKIRFAAIQKEGFLCDLEPNRKYNITLILVPLWDELPAKVHKHNVVTRSADSSSSRPTTVAATSVSNLAEAAIANSNDKVDKHDSVETVERKTENNAFKSEEDMGQTSPTSPSELNVQGFSEPTPGFSTSADALAETMVTISDDEGDDRDSSRTQSSNRNTLTIPAESIEDGILQEKTSLRTAIADLAFGLASILAHHGIPYISSFSVIHGGEPSLNRMSSGAPDPNSSHNDSIRTLTKSEYIETTMVELQTQSNIGTPQEEVLPPAAITVTVFGILSLLALAISVFLLFVRRRRKMREMKLNIAMVDSDDVKSKISSEL